MCDIDHGGIFETQNLSQLLPYQDEQPAYFVKHIDLVKYPDMFD